jgi:hypothetical protein
LVNLSTTRLFKRKADYNVGWEEDEIRDILIIDCYSVLTALKRKSITS